MGNFLQSFLASFIPQAQQEFQAAGQNAISPELFKQGQENARAAAERAQQLTMHNQMTPYESGVLDLDKQKHSDSQDAAADEQNANLIKMIQGGATLTTNTADPSAIPYGDKYVIPSTAKLNTYNISKDSDVGKFMGLDTDLHDLKPEDYLGVYKDYANHHIAQDSKTATAEVIDQQKKALEDEANYRFSPDFYNRTYGQGQIDPNAQQWQKMFQAQLEASAATDKKSGSTTQIDSAAKQLREYQSQWEKMRNETKLAGMRSAVDAESALNAKYPQPDPTEIKQWADATQQRGTKMLLQAKQVNPRLAQSVETELAHRGVNLFNLTTQEQDTRDLAGIGLPLAQRALNMLSQPGVEQSFGPASSRWQDFMANSVGSMTDPRWKQIQDKLILLKGLVGKMHYSARGAANEHIQAVMNNLFNPKTMDVQTLRQGIQDTQDILKLYANEGGDSNAAQSSTTPPVLFQGPGGKK